jgi:hypothetical protein
MTRRTDRRAACSRARGRGTSRAAAELRTEVRALRRRIEGLWSVALLGEPIELEDVHAIAVTLAALRLRIDVLAPTRPGEPAIHDVAMARDDMACCVVTVSDLVAYFAAA